MNRDEAFYKIESCHKRGFDVCKNSHKKRFFAFFLVEGSGYTVSKTAMLLMDIFMLYCLLQAASSGSGEPGAAEKWGS